MDHSPSVTAQKKALRTLFREKRSSITEEEKRVWDEALIFHISQHPFYQCSKAILLFSPVRGEPDLLPLVSLALKDGKKVGFPISHPEDRTMTFYAIKDLSELSIGTYGIPEPPAHGEILNHRSDALCLVPALAFDRLGYRLGYGGGYYDKFLKRFNGVTLGVTYDSLIADTLPTGVYDVPVDIIITERRSIIPNAKK